MGAQAIEFFIDSTMLLRATVTDIDDKPVNGATVECTIVHAFGSDDDTELDCSEMDTPITWPVTLVGVGSGKYEYTFAYDLPIVGGERYKAKTETTVGSTKRYSEPYIKPIVDRD
jgi:hypothetical protein